MRTGSIDRRHLDPQLIITNIARIKKLIMATGRTLGDIARSGQAPLPHAATAYDVLALSTDQSSLHGNHVTNRAEHIMTLVVTWKALILPPRKPRNREVEGIGYDKARALPHCCQHDVE